MLEDVLQLGKEGLLVDELQALEVQEVGFQLLLHAGDHLEDAEGEVSSDDRGYLQGTFEVLLQTVHAGGDDALDAIGHLDLGGGFGEGEGVVLLADGPIL